MDSTHSLCPECGSEIEVFIQTFGYSVKTRTISWRCDACLASQKRDLSAGEDPVVAAERFSRGRGVDAVIITATTKSSEPMHQAALMCRKRGRIVLIGVTGLNLSRDDFF